MDPAACAVIFDIDGTLVDSTYHHAVAWHRAFQRYDEPPPMWRVHRCIGMGGDRLVTEVAGPGTEERLGNQLRGAWREEYLPLRHEVRALPGAADLVRRLAGTVARVALASSGDPQFAQEAVELLDIGDELELVTTSEDVDSSKPDPDLITETLHRMPGVEQALLVGDTVHDVESANRAGVPCIGLLCGGYGLAELVDAGAVHVAELPEDLGDVDWESYLTR